MKTNEGFLYPEISHKKHFFTIGFHFSCILGKYLVIIFQYGNIIDAINMKIFDKLKDVFGTEEMSPAMQALCRIIDTYNERIERLEVVVSRHTRQIHDQKYNGIDE